MARVKSKRSKACDISKSVKDKVWVRDKEMCIICGNANAMPNAHFIRRSQGGLGIEENVVTLCQRCHHEFDNGKNTRLYTEKVESYLKSKYKHWSKEDLYYKK